MTCPIRFKYDIEKFVAAVAYLAFKKPSDFAKLKIVKLMYFADKMHLQRYARPITGDRYRALPYGPVPTLSLDILNEAQENHQSYGGIKDSNVQLLLKFLIIDNTRKHPTFSNRKAPDIDVLSASEMEVLDEVFKEYGNMTGTQLISETHKEPYWTRTNQNDEIDFRMLLEDLDEETRHLQVQILEQDQENRELFDYCT